MRQVMLESALNTTSRSPSPEPITHVEEQRMLRDETIAVFHGAVEGDNDKEDSDDDLLILRERTKDELEKEEEEYRAFLQREVGEDLENLVTVEESMVAANNAVDADEPKKKGKKEKDPGQKGRSRSKQETDQEFLMKFVFLNPLLCRVFGSCVILGSYILNRGWIDRSAGRIPTYREITDTKGKKRSLEKDDDYSEAGNTEGDAENSADDEFEDLADAFESSYNFRFEEPYVFAC
jgi:protein KRI1